MSSLRALVVCYSFPPVGGAGVARVTKLVKYLPEHEIAPSVLTAQNPSVPVLDHSLVGDVPSDIEVVRVRTLEPDYKLKRAAWTAAASSSPLAVAPPTAKQRVVHFASSLVRNFLIPDPQLLWQPNASRAMVARLARKRDDVVVISGPPFSQFLLAGLVRARPGVAVVLDYRDEWSTYRSTYEMMGSVAGRIGGPLESGLLRCAHAVTTATEAFRENLLERFRFLDPSRVHAIPNGYDSDDFPAGLPRPPSDRFVLTYAGTIFKLTSARGLLGAIRRLHEREPELAKLLEVRFLGRIVDTEQFFFEGMDKLGVTQLGYVAHDNVIPALASSHMVLCLLDEAEGVERIYPAKIFELMYLGRRCLTLAPPGALSELVLQQRFGDVLAPRDEPAIAEYLAKQLRAFRDGTYRSDVRAVDIDRYHRRALAGRFADVFRQAVVDARGAGALPS